MIDNNANVIAEKEETVLECGSRKGGFLVNGECCCVVFVSAAKLYFFLSATA